MVQPMNGFAGNADNSTMRVSKETSKEKIATDRTAFRQKTVTRCHGALPTETDAYGMMQIESREPNHEPSGDATSPCSGRNITMKTRTGRVVTMKTYRNDQYWISDETTTRQRIQDEAREEPESIPPTDASNTLSFINARSSVDIHSFITDEVRQDSKRSTATSTAATCLTDEARQKPTELTTSSISLDNLLDLVRDYPWADDPEAFPGEAELRISIANLRQEAANREIMKRLAPLEVDSVFLPASPTPNQSANVTGKKVLWVGQSDEPFHGEEEFEDEDPYYDQEPLGRSKILLWFKAEPFCLVISLMIAGTIAFGLWYIILSKNLSTNAHSGLCSLCHDGSIPDNLNSNEVGHQTCSEFLEDQEQLKASDPLCTNAQVLTWHFCDCPTLPPLPDNRSSCQLCPDGSPPESQFCKDYMAFLVYMYDVDNWCDAIIGAAIKTGCTCPQTQRPRDPLDPEPWDEDVRPHINEERPEDELSEPVPWEKIPGKKCSFCYDGSIPQDLLSNEVGDQTCADYRVELEALDAYDEGCRSGQALTWLMCACPSLPPTPDYPSCSLCGEGVHLANKACDDINTFMAQSSDAETCAEFKKTIIDEGCTCPSSP